MHNNHDAIRKRIDTLQALVLGVALAWTPACDESEDVEHDASAAPVSEASADDEDSISETPPDEDDDREPDASAESMSETSRAEDAGNARTPGDDTGDGMSGPSARYLVHSATQTDDGRTNFFSVSDTLTEDRVLDYAQSLEHPGRARLYADRDGDTVIIGDAEDMTLTRYTVHAEGRLEPGDSLSLQAEAVSSLGAQAVLFVSPTKAYYKDAGEGQIIVWNPAEMQIEETILLPEELIQEGYLLGVSEWAQREGEAYFAVSWYTSAYDRVLEGTALVRIDTETDEISVTEEDRCRGLKTAANVDGVLYFFSDVINAFGHAVYPDDAGQQDCILRIAEGESTFDPDYLESLAGALPEDTAAAAATVTSEGQVFAQVADLAVAPTTPGTTYGEWYASGWSWWRLPLATLDNAERIDLEAGAYAGFTFESGERLFVARSEDDYAETTLADISGDMPEPGLRFSGFALDVAAIGASNAK